MKENNNPEFDTYIFLSKKGINRPITRQQAYRIINNAAKQCGVTVLDPAEILCKNSKCIAQYNNRPIYQDGDHLSEYGNKLLIPLFRGII